MSNGDAHAVTSESHDSVRLVRESDGRVKKLKCAKQQNNELRNEVMELTKTTDALEQLLRAKLSEEVGGSSLQ